MYSEKVVNADAERGVRTNPNAGFVPINEPVEQQAPLGYGMPPAPTGETVGGKGKKRAVLEEEQGVGRGTRYSYEQPEVVVEGERDGKRGTLYGDDVYEA